MSDLAEQIRDLIDGCAPTVTLEAITTRAGEESKSSLRRPLQLRKGRWLVAASALVLIVAVSLIATWSEPSPRKAAEPQSTVRIVHWNLTAALSGPQFQLATGNPAAVVGVDCGNGQTCFLSTGYGLGGDSSNNGSTYVSADGGQTWNPSSLPSNVAATTLVSCVTANWCAGGGGLADPSTGDPAAGKVMRDPELLTSTNGGASWSMHAVPIPPDIQQLPAYGNLPAETTYWPASVDAVSCNAPGVCSVITHVLNSSADSGLTPDDLVFASTSDGGVTWTTSILPELPDEAGYEVMPAGGVGASSLSCPDAATCVVVAHLGGLSSAQAAFDAWRTTNGGQTWQESRLASGFSALVNGESSTVACPNMTTCWAGPALEGANYPNGALLRSRDDGASWSPVALPAPSNAPSQSQGQTITTTAWDALSCTSGSACFIGGTGIDLTTDSGRTWQSASLPSQVSWVDSLSCGTGHQGICVAAAVPKTSSSLMPYGGSLMIASKLSS
jgi:hypothetical protein